MGEKGEKIGPARAAAWMLLQKLHIPHTKHSSDTPLPTMLENEVRQRKLTPQDTALVRELVYGILRTKGRIRALLQPFLSRPETLPPALVLLLLLGSYELLFLSRIPPYATLHQTVNMARGQYGSRLAALCNAVLRAVDRNRDRLRGMDAADIALLSSKDDYAGDANDIARLGSLPHWLATCLLNQHGPEGTRHIVRNVIASPRPAYRLNLTRPDTTNTRRLLDETGAQWETTGTGFHMPALSCDSSLLTSLEVDGRISRQGLASQAVVTLLAQTIHNDYPANTTLWDACCGRGGKTCALLEKGIQVSLASDTNASRLQVLQTSLARLRLTPPKILCESAENLARQHPAAFPLVLLDVPCSGTGTLARVPELRQRLTPDRIAAAAAIQSRLLEHVWPGLAPGGLLAYVTCSLLHEENDHQISRFLAHTSHASLVAMRLLPPPQPGQDYLFVAMLRKNA